MPTMGGMMPQNMAGMMPHMMGMMPQMMGGMMPHMMGGMMPVMMCHVSCEMGADGMTCRMTPMGGMAKEMFDACCKTMMSMMDAGMPCMMHCGGMMMLCMPMKAA
jgi:hypothetical protein